MEPVNSNRKSVLSPLSTNVQPNLLNDQCEIGLLRFQNDSLSSKNSSLLSIRRAPKMDQTYYSDDGQSDEENQPPINGGDFQFKEPYRRKMLKDDGKLNAIIDNLNFLKIGESPRPESRFNLFKWTTPLKGNKNNIQKNQQSDPDLSASETDEEFVEAMESLQELDSKPDANNHSLTSTANEKSEEFSDKKDKGILGERVPKIADEVSGTLNAEELDEFVDAEANEIENVVNRLMGDSVIENDFHLTVSNNVSVVEDRDNDQTFTVESDLTFEVEVKSRHIVQILEENDEDVDEVDTEANPVIVTESVSTSVLETFGVESNCITTPEKPCLDDDVSRNCEINSDEIEAENEGNDESIAIKITTTHSEEVESIKTAKNGCEEFLNVIQTLENEIITNVTPASSHCKIRSEFNVTENIELSLEEISDTSLEISCDYDLNLSENRSDMSLTEIFTESEIDCKLNVIQKNESVSYKIIRTSEENMQEVSNFEGEKSQIKINVSSTLSEFEMKNNFVSEISKSTSSDLNYTDILEREKSQIILNAMDAVPGSEFVIKSEYEGDMKVAQNSESENNQINLNSTYSFTEPENATDCESVIPENEEKLISSEINELYFDSNQNPDIDIIQNLDSENSQINLNLTSITPDTPVVRENESLISNQTNEVICDSIQKLHMNVTLDLESEKSQINSNLSGISPELEHSAEKSPVILENESISNHANEVFLNSAQKSDMNVTHNLESENSQINLNLTSTSPEPEHVGNESISNHANEVFLDSAQQLDINVTHNLESENSQINLNLTSISPEPVHVSENAIVIPENKSISNYPIEVFLDSARKSDMNVTHNLESEKSQINLNLTSISPDPKYVAENSPIFPKNEVYLDSAQNSDMNVTHNLESEKSQINLNLTNTSLSPECMTESESIIPENEELISNQINEEVRDSTQNPVTNITKNLDPENSQVNLLVTESESTVSRNSESNLHEIAIFPEDVPKLTLTQNLEDDASQIALNISQILTEYGCDTDIDASLAKMSELVLYKTDVKSLESILGEDLNSTGTPEEESKVNLNSTKILCERELKDELDTTEKCEEEGSEVNLNSNETSYESEVKNILDTTEKCESFLLNPEQILGIINNISVSNSDPTDSHKTAVVADPSIMERESHEVDDKITSNFGSVVENYFNWQSSSEENSLKRGSTELEINNLVQESFPSYSFNTMPEEVANNLFTLNFKSVSIEADEILGIPDNKKVQVSVKNSETQTVDKLMETRVSENMVDENQSLVPEIDSNLKPGSQDEETHSEVSERCSVEMDIDADDKGVETNKIMIEQIECGSEMRNEDDDIINEELSQTLNMEACQRFLNRNRYSLPVIMECELENILNSSKNEQETESLTSSEDQSENGKPDSESCSELEQKIPDERVPDRKSIEIENNVENQAVNVTYDLLQEKVEESVSNKVEPVNEEIQQKSDDCDEFKTPERNDFDDSMFCKPMPVSKKIEATSSSPCLLIFESCFNADYCAGNTPKSSRNTSLMSMRSPYFRSSVKGKKKSLEMSQTGPALLDMSIDCFEQYTANVASNFPNAINGSDLNRTVDIDDTSSFHPKPEELLIVPEYPRSRNVKTQTHDNELDELKNENKYLRDLVADLTQKYNGLYEVSLALRENEAILKAAVAEHEDNNRKLSNQYDLLKDYSNTLLAQSNQELDEMAKINSILRTKLKDCE